MNEKKNPRQVAFRVSANVARQLLELQRSERRRVSEICRIIVEDFLTRTHGNGFEWIPAGNDAVQESITIKAGHPRNN